MIMQAFLYVYSYLWMAVYITSGETIKFKLL